MKKSKGITLVALVITIIILLILAGVAISQLTNSGLFTKSREAEQSQKRAEAIEDINLKIAEAQMEKEGNATLADFVKVLKEDENNVYNVKLEKTAQLKSGSKNETEVTAAEAIYVTNEKYGVEVEISNDFKVSLTGAISEGGGTLPEQIDAEEVSYTPDPDLNWTGVSNVKEALNYLYENL